MATAAKPSPISTPLTALMLISALAISASSRSNTGSPQPGGTPIASTVIAAPMESPSRRSSLMKVSSSSNTRRIGAEERVFTRGRGLGCCQLDRPQLAQIAADRHAEALGQYLARAIAPAATRMAVSRAEERPPPR